MKNGYPYDRLNIVARMMTGLGILGTVLIVLLRVWIVPAQRDIDTGLFTSNVLVIGLMLVMVAILGALVFILRGGPRREIVGGPSLALSTVALIVGVGMLLHGAIEAAARLGWISFYSVTSLFAGEKVPFVQTLLPWLQTAFSVLSGVAFIWFGLRLASEGGTRRGMAQWSLLAPVLWMWFVLANYMMSYASMVRITEGFFTLAMYIMELLFLFRFACYIAGVGQMGVGSVLFFSAGAAMFALSAPLVRWLMYLLQDGEAVTAAGAAGPLDLAVGVLALMVSITLCQSLSASSAEETEEEESDEDAPEWTGSDDSAFEAELIEELDTEDVSEE